MSPTTIPLRWSAATARALVYSLVIVAPLIVPVVFILDMDLLALLRDVGGVPSSSLQPLVFLPTGGLALLAALVLPLVCLRLRHRGGASIEIDQTEIREMEGTEVRTAIAWAGAKLHTHDSKAYRRVTRHRRALMVVGRLVQVVSPTGHAISWGFGRWLPHWARRRPTSASADAQQVLPASLPTSEATLDPRDARRPAPLRFRLVGAAGVAAFGLGIANAFEHGMSGGHGGVVGAFMLLAGLLAALRLLRPLIEALRIVREDASDRGAVEGRIGAGSEPGALRLETPRGAMTVDVRAAAHPDVHLARRVGTAVRVVVASAASDPFRGPVSTPASAITTERDRRERRRILVACLIEVVARGTFAFLVLFAGVIMAAGLQES